MSAGIEALTPYMPRIKHLLLDDGISEIMVNPNGSVFTERDGFMHQEPIDYLAADLEQAVKRIARAMGRDINEQAPLFQGRLSDGSRVAIVGSPCAVGGVAISIRKFGNRKFSVEDLVSMGSLSRQQADRLLKSVEDRDNIVISGATSSGKSSLINALAERIPAHERVVVIEDVLELKFTRPNVVRLEARPTPPEVTIRDLLKITLRLRPDSIVIGEVRGEEVLDFLSMANTGHRGTLLSIHANSCEDALQQMFMFSLISKHAIPERFIKESIGRNVHLLVQMERVDGKRRVSEILGVVGYQASTDTFKVEAA